VLCLVFCVCSDVVELSASTVGDLLNDDGSSWHWVYLDVHLVEPFIIFALGGSVLGCHRIKLIGT
jgi:hypothetical protein